MRKALSPISLVVDVIIPVYRGFKETQSCLESVLAHLQTTEMEVVVINDSTPDKAIREYLENLANDKKITLLNNPINQGFVNAVNRGMTLHPERDVVLLNSDAEVHGNWLDRLRNCAYSDSLVGTVTPFSNNATICSYPRFTEINCLPEGWSLNDLDDLFYKLNDSQSLEIPTAVGFCMYITRHCLNQVGYFDASLFKEGYGEENDFCMRALDLGFKNLLCADTFVYHKGGVSFADKADDLCAAAQEKIKELHPHYYTLVNDFCTQDPARSMRRHIDFHRLTNSPRQRILFVTHVWGGGTEKHVQELVNLLSKKFEILILRPKSLQEISVEWANSGEEFIVYFSLPYTYSELLEFLKHIKISFIHFHHIIGVNQQVLQIPNDLGVLYNFTLHDYYPFCPQFTLTNKDGSYCGEPDVTGCTSCLQERPAPWGMDILSWRALFKDLLNKAHRIIAPSQDALERTRKYFPDACYQFLPHPEPSAIHFSSKNSSFLGNEFKILILGRLSLMKGSRLLEACAIDAQERKLPLYFKVIGFSVEEIKKEPEIPLSFHGPYDDSQLSLLIARERADLIFFPALWPETYSYTLSEAMRSHLPIVAPRIGAFIERLTEYPSAHLLDWKSSAKQYNDFFIQLKSTNFFQSDFQKKVSMMSNESFVESYINSFPEIKPTFFDSYSYIDLNKHLYPADFFSKRYIYTLNRKELIKIIQDLPNIRKNSWITQEDFVSSIQDLVYSNQELKSCNEKQAFHIKELENEVAKKAEDVSRLDIENTMYRQNIQELENQLIKLKEYLEEIYCSTSWMVTKPIRFTKNTLTKAKKTLPEIINFPLLSGRRLLFKSALFSRNKLNVFRLGTQKKHPKLSQFIVEPPFFLLRKYIRPIAKEFALNFFNDVAYEQALASAISKEDTIKNNNYQQILNFIPSERFRCADKLFQPKVTVIVPNYNHSAFLEKRLDSIYRQTYKEFSVILLDDCSSDTSKDILIEYKQKYPEITQVFFNKKNSGSAFLQWKRGIDLADSDIIWIAESDDFCDDDFLQTLVPFFMDEAIQLAYTRSVFIGTDDQPTAFKFDDYLCELDQKKWSVDYIESAHNEVGSVLGKKNTIPNVSSTIFRKPKNLALFNQDSWLNMRICGDWIFYLHLIKGGKIAFTNRTLNYYRFHSANSSVATYKKSIYYTEHQVVAETIAQLYKVPNEVLYENKAFIERFWKQNMEETEKVDFKNIYSISEVLNHKRNRLPNILIASFSFSTGGGEIFPIRLANEFKKKGYSITFFNFNREPVNDNVRKMLSSDIPVFECTQEIGNLDQFLINFGIEIIHTHHASTEHFFAAYMNKTRKKVKHIVTMHGMYETLEQVHADKNLPIIIKNVDLWVYIADKNLDLFKAKGYNTKDKFIKIGNGMAPPEINAIDRKELNISDDAFVLCQASRSIPEKGWEEAIEIIKEARSISKKNIHLILLGDGPIYQSLLAQELPDYIHLLGFKNNPVDYYAMSDIGFLPSRFHGESFPLSIIECLFSGKPFIASDIGEIRNMLTVEGEVAGAIFNLDNWRIPISNVAQIVAEFSMNRQLYKKAQEYTQKAANRFNIKNIVEAYEKAYQRVLE